MANPIPTIGTLHKLEQYTGLKITDLIILFNAGCPPRPLLKMVAAEAPYTKNCLHLRNFLLKGIGYYDFNEKPLPQDILQNLQNPAWLDMFKTYVGMMGHSAQEFWQLTVEEFELAFKGFCLLHDLDTQRAVPPTRKELALLTEQFPDGP